jgi:hypothetical protein
MQWRESIDIEADQATVLAAIADEHAVMQWSAWPQATGFTCSVDGDGRTLGSEIVFVDKSGVEQGRQKLTAVTKDRVEYRLRNRGPGGRDIEPEVDFVVEPLGPGTTRVHLDFRATPPVPALLRPLVERAMARRVRALHVEDLRLLKAYVEDGSGAAAA